MKKLLLILFLFGCENIITDISDNPDDNPDSANYGIVINEINYNSSSDSNLNAGDWIELYNPTNQAIEMSLWEFRDEDNIFTFPENIILAPGGYLVLCQNLDVFSQIFSSVSNTLGDLEFGLSGAGELIRLFDPDGILVDGVEYDDIAPWPIDPDGYGPTLELIDSSLDNALGENWDASNENGGTPGEINSVVKE